MAFNSFVFDVFLIVVFLLYWSLQRRPLIYQNLLLLIASYFFYAWWDYRFLALLIASSVVNYLIGLGLKRSEQPRKRKLILMTSMLFNLGTLILFKYLGFFVSSFVELLGLIGLHADSVTLNLILPLGISYYTFQMVGYTIDVYRKEFPATDDLLAFLLFQGFFPKLVAGPIERAANLLPQIQTKRVFKIEHAKDGARQILWGLFKKAVIADNLAVSVAYIFHNYSSLDGLTLLIGSFLFAIQIYCDFSGYSDMAIGMARLFGIDLMRNFAYPYFARDIGEFWRRWHISLSTWFRDYVFFPLGWLRRGRVLGIRNVLVTFTLSGLWHGAAWTFVAWGFLNGLYFIPQILARKTKRYGASARERILPSFVELRQMLLTFLLILLAWVFFRADSLGHAFGYIARAVTNPWSNISHGEYLPVVMTCLAFLIVEWVQRTKEHALEISRLPIILRWMIYYFIIVLLFWYGNTGNVPFIYVRF